MTKEEKDLLLQDLCERLQHGLKVNHFEVIRELLGIIPSTENVMVGYDINDYEVSVIEDIKPYLRPMSSMTSKEWVEFCDCSLKDEMSWVITRNRQKLIPVQNREDYLNSKHFDYRGLIPMGLALEAPDGMYK